MANDPAASAALEYRKRKAANLEGHIEHREFEVGGLEVRELDDGTLRMTGYGSVTEVEYPVGPYTEVIRRGAFRRTLSESPDTVLLFGHDGMPLARTRTGTLAMEEDAKGLKWTADLDAEDPESRVLARKVERGLIDQCSFAFLVTDQEWSDDWTLRSIKSVSLHRGDISLVTMGANEATSVSNVRSADLVGAFYELRAGRVLSAANVEILTNALNLTSDAEDSAGQARDLLDGLINPESDDGEADTVERSITDTAELRMAIHEALRAPGRDERRTHLMVLAREMSVPGLVPEAWQRDGSLSEGSALDTQEQRETYNDTYTALDAALDDKLVDNGDFYYVWVQDFTATDVIFCAGGDLWSAPYTLTPGGPVTIGEPVNVRPVTEYVPMNGGAESIEDETDEPRVAVDEMLALPDLTTRARQEFELLMLREARR